MYNEDNKLFSYIKSFLEENEDLRLNAEFKFTISTILEEYLKLQNKPFFSQHSSGKNFYYDGFAPYGFDIYDGPLAFEYKLYKDDSMVNLYRRFLNFLDDIKGEGINTIIFIVPNIKDKDVIIFNKKFMEISDYDVEIWNLKELGHIYDEIKSKNDKFDEFLNDVYRYYLDYQISKSFESSNVEREEEYIGKIEELKKIYKSRNINLFLGAGVSADANIPIWDDLILKLFMELMDDIVSENDISLNLEEKKEMEDIIKYDSGFSPIIKTRILKTGFREGLETKLKDLMYKNKTKSETKLINSISDMCKDKNYRKTGVSAIVTYNFDDLLEQSLRRKNIEHESIYSEALLPVENSLGIYHVHGFIPNEARGYSSLENSILVFSEEEYHRIMSDPYNWANLTQLDLLTNETCVFIGLSLTDPNLRRILDISYSKKSVRYNKTYHYAFLKRPSFKKIKNNSNMEKLKKINLDLLENFYKESGISIIWFDKFEDLPKILDYISESL